MNSVQSVQDILQLKRSQVCIIKGKVRSKFGTDYFSVLVEQLWRTDTRLLPTPLMFELRLYIKKAASAPYFISTSSK
jgi:hypothetical protein